MKALWIVRWRGTEERCVSEQDAMDCWDRLDAVGIDAEVFEVQGGNQRQVNWTGPAMRGDLR